MTLTAEDQAILDRFQAADFVVDETDKRRIMVSLASYAGDVSITETGIIYGPYGAQREWTLHGPQGEDVSGAMRWAVDETKRIMLADADALIAKLRSAAI